MWTTDILRSVGPEAELEAVKQYITASLNQINRSVVKYFLII